MRFLANRLPPHDFGVIARLEENYINAILDEYVLQKAMQKLARSIERAIQTSLS
jgi:hypothetical protein